MDAYQRIGVATTNRADYGIYRPLLVALRESRYSLDIFAGGTHPLPRFGRTLDQVETDGFGAIHTIAHADEGDRGVDIASSFGRAVTQFAHTYSSARPDLLFVLGDRYEMFAAGVAAAILKIPLAHLHGGDVTEGAYDDQFRHALTKLAHVHFPALREHADRIVAMGEEPWRVHVTGSLALDELARFRADPPGVITREIKLNPSLPTLLLSYHPETLSPLLPADSFDKIAQGLASWTANIVVLGTNADEGHVRLTARIQHWSDQRPNIAFVPAMPQHRFWSWMSHAAVMVGNSSSGIIESPSFRLPVVNVGDRQKGRVRTRNVIDVPCEAAAIAAAIGRAVSPAFRDGLGGLLNPYGNGAAATRILSILRGLPGRDTLLRKRWGTA